MTDWLGVAVLSFTFVGLPLWVLAMQWVARIPNPWRKREVMRLVPRYRVVKALDYRGLGRRRGVAS